MKISVVTAVYNNADFIRGTVESILGQQGAFELEYIVCDGGSTDGTTEILREYERAGRLTLIVRRDRGPCDAINYGMARATGEIGCWLNGDDLFRPGALAAVADYFAAHPGCRWLYGRCRIVDGDGREVRRPITWYKNLLGFFYSRNVLLCENFISQPATFWRMDLWREVGGGLDSAYRAAWDYELWLKMAMLAPAAALHRELAEFRRHPGSISENHFEKQFAEELAIASAYGNALHRLIHRFNCWKIVTAYRLLS